MARSGGGTKRQKNGRTDHINGKLYGPSDFYTSKPGINAFEPFSPDYSVTSNWKSQLAVRQLHFIHFNIV